MKSQSFRAREAGFAHWRGRPYLGGMTDRPKRPRDANQLAKFIVDVATGESRAPVDDGSEPKNAAAVELGRRGGLKGGKARASSLSPSRRAEIARDAAAARWKKSPPTE